MNENIRTANSGGVLSLQLCRPEKRNAILPAMYLALAEQLRIADDNDTIRVIVFHGAGDYFTSGNDLNNFRNCPSTMEGQFPHNVLLEVLSKTKKPVIAAVNGPALGIGTIMLLHCDLVISSDEARFSFPFIKFGLSPEGGVSYLLPRLVGCRKAMEMVLFGEEFGAEVAQEIGLINEVISTQKVIDRTMERAGTLAAKSTKAVQAAKKLMKSSTSLSITQAIDNERTVFNERLASVEAQTAINQFLNRSKV